MTVRWRLKILKLQDFSEPLQLFLLLNQKESIHFKQWDCSGTAAELWVPALAGEQPDGGTQHRLPPALVPIPAVVLPAPRYCCSGLKQRISREGDF